jgi:hypothetical protein
MRGRHKYVLHSFSLHHGFIPLGFPGKVFNEAVHTHKGWCTLFPSLGFFPNGFFSSKVLMRHILDGHPRGSVMNNCRWMSIVLAHIIGPYVFLYIGPMLQCKTHLWMRNTIVLYSLSLFHLLSISILLSITLFHNTLSAR